MDKNNFFLPNGDIHSRRLGRFISLIEDHPEQAEVQLAELYHENTQATVLGITGPPGAGKSSLTDGLISRYRALGKRVAVIAVDSSSPFSGGAILGDRIRMAVHATDPGVFIRSMGSRGSLGGLAPATIDVMNLLTSIDFDVVIIETVGVGQTEIDIMHLVDTVLLILVPGLGDDIQALKAGVMEIADIFVVNKADKPGTQKLLAEINMTLALVHERLVWLPPVVETVATEYQGLEQLLEEISKHSEYIAAHQDDVKQKKRVNRFTRMIEDKFTSHVLSIMQENEQLTSWIQEVGRGQANPYAALKMFDKKLKIVWED